MKLARHWLLAAALPAFLIGAPLAHAGDATSWEGTWNGTLGHIEALADFADHLARQGRQLHRRRRAARCGVQQSHFDKVIFGDGTHYSMKIIKTGDATAAGKVHGRHGFGSATLTKG